MFNQSHSLLGNNEGANGSRHSLSDYIDKNPENSVSPINTFTTNSISHLFSIPSTPPNGSSPNSPTATSFDEDKRFKCEVCVKGKTTQSKIIP